MTGGFTNRPRIFHGAFAEYGLTIPPLIVPFQFNPEELSRSRSLHYSVPSKAIRGERNRESGRDRTEPWELSLRDFHKREEYKDLIQLQKDQKVTVAEETLSFKILLDGTDKLSTGDPISAQYGIAPQLATLELMLHPKEESQIGQALSALLGPPEGFSFTKGENPPMILFIWGPNRILPVNITSMSIDETEFSATLNPIRAEVSVNLTVIEGANIPYRCSKAIKEAMSTLNLSSMINITDVVIPG